MLMYTIFMTPESNVQAKLYSEKSGSCFKTKKIMYPIPYYHLSYSSTVLKVSSLL